uniref:Uncharacterized protein n=1 Tax=Anguilla anguilla TaxID=7936 RepID=A0A0E9U8G4_ANGAN
MELLGTERLRVQFPGGCCFSKVLNLNCFSIYLAV